MSTRSGGGPDATAPAGASRGERATVSRAGWCYAKGSTAEERWLARTLDGGEIVLAWLPVASVSPPEALADAPSAGCSVRFLMTADGTALVAFSPAPTRRAEPPEPRVHELPRTALTVGSRDLVGREQVSVVGWRWKSGLGGGDRFRELAPLAGMPAPARRREAARLNWVRRERRDRPDGRAALAAALLEDAARWGGPLEQLAEGYVAAALARGASGAPALEGPAALERVRPALEALPAMEDAPGRLADWAVGWGLPLADQRALIEALLDHGDEATRAALPLHRRLHRASLAIEKDLSRRAAVDIELAEHLLEAAERDEARQILELRLKTLPDETVADLLPPRDVDLTAHGAETLRIRLLELLTAARGAPGAPDVESLAELARLQPLVAARVDELVSRTQGTPLGGRAARLAEVLAPGGLEPREGDAAAEGKLRELPPAELAARLPHPASRASGALDWLQEKLGQVTPPDRGALRSYAERVTAKNQPGVVAALADATLALGVGGVEAYVSRGDRAAGIRAYEGTPPFVIIGAEHLDPASDLFMRPPVLLFALGTEVAHLRFKHTRLTSSDVWDGVWAKGTQLLNVLGSLSGPLGILGTAMGGLGRLGLAQGLLRKAELLTAGAGRAREVALGFRQVGAATATGAPKPPSQDLGARESELLAVCRLMQLTADRAGLTLCGDPRAAVEAIFLSSEEHRVELPVARRHGLVTALSRRDAQGELVSQALAIRLAALLSFYLSADFEALRAAVVGA